MNNTPKVSVILASYKHCLWIEEAILSVINQTFSDLELIIVDDGSNDGSDVIIQNYAKKDSRIKYELFDKNQGAIRAMQRCYEMCSGEYIAVISSDDIWELHKLEKQVHILDENKNLGAVFSVPTFIDGKGNVISNGLKEFKNSVKPRSKDEWMNSFFNIGNCICHPSILIRKECYKKVGFYNPLYRSLPDFEFWVRLFYHYEIQVLPDKLIKFRKHQFNESGSNMDNIIRCQTEYKYILFTFLEQIDSLDRLKSIFPEHKDLYAVNDDALVPFYLAQIALKRKVPLFSDFAIDILYKEMSNLDVLAVIEKNNLYSFQEFSKAISLSDIYAIRVLNNTDFINISWTRTKALVKIFLKKICSIVQRIYRT